MGPPGTAGLAAEKLLSKKFACENCSYKGGASIGLTRNFSPGNHGRAHQGIPGHTWSPKSGLIAAAEIHRPFDRVLNKLAGTAQG